MSGLDLLDEIHLLDYVLADATDVDGYRAGCRRAAGTDTVAVHYTTRIRVAIQWLFDPKHALSADDVRAGVATLITKASEATTVD